MMFLKTIDDLKDFLKKTDELACLADTGFLYGLSYDDDRLHSISNDVLDLLAEIEVDVYANVISRMEFIDLIFRKQITSGAIKLFDKVNTGTKYKKLFNLLKSIRDEETAAKRSNSSYKVNETRLKKLRHLIEEANEITSWKDFCHKYISELLQNEWKYLEEDYGLKFIEIMENNISKHFNHPLMWSDMVDIMGHQGLRAPDAMILNLFSKSALPLLITGDTDFEKSLPDELIKSDKKAIYFLQCNTNN